MKAIKTNTISGGTIQTDTLSAATLSFSCSVCHERISTPCTNVVTVAWTKIVDHDGKMFRMHWFLLPSRETIHICGKILVGMYGKDERFRTY